MVFECKLPDVGEGVAEGEVVKWLVKEGQEVIENQPLVEIMTDKVNVEIPSPRKGTVLSLNAKEGEVVKVGQVLITIAEKGEPSSAPKPTPAPVSTPAAAKAEEAPSRAVAPAIQRKLHEILATPATRKLARDLGVDLEMVQAAGPGGRITEEDVRKFKQPGTCRRDRQA